MGSYCLMGTDEKVLEMENGDGCTTCAQCHCTLKGPKMACFMLYIYIATKKIRNQDEKTCPKSYSEHSLYQNSQLPEAEASAILIFALN